MKLKPRFLARVVDFTRGPGSQLAFDFTICQVCDRPVCFRKSTLKVMYHHLPKEGYRLVYGMPVPLTKSVKCPGSGQKRVLKLLKGVALSECDVV